MYICNVYAESFRVSVSNTNFSHTFTVNDFKFITTAPFHATGEILSTHTASVGYTSYVHGSRWCSSELWPRLDNIETFSRTYIYIYIFIVYYYKRVKLLKILRFMRARVCFFFQKRQCHRRTCVIII